MGGLMTILWNIALPMVKAKAGVTPIAFLTDRPRGKFYMTVSSRVVCLFNVAADAAGATIEVDSAGMKELPPWLDVPTLVQAAKDTMDSEKWCSASS